MNKLRSILSFTVLAVLLMICGRNVYAAEMKIKASKITGSSFELSWSKDPSAEVYMVYVRKGSSGSFKKYKTVKGTSCLVEGVKPDTSYTVKIGSFVKKNKSYRQVAESRTLAVKTKEKGTVVDGIMYAKLYDTVTFNDTEWLVIKKSSKGCTLLLKDAQGKRRVYHDGCETTWEECDLRRWLNSTYYDTFGEEEKKFIVKTHCENKDNEKWGTKGGNDTEDYIYLLSIDEASELPKKVLLDDGWWWLRSPGEYQSNAAVITHDSLGVNGEAVFFEALVRPVLSLEW